MCKYYVYNYESCRHKKLIRKERCWEAQVDGYCSWLSLSSCLYPNSTHRKVTLHTTMRGLCHDCDNRQRNTARRDYGNFNAQPTYGVGSSQGARQAQASDYSCGGLNERPVRAPDRSYQPDGYQTQAQMSYSAPQQRAPGSSQIPSYGYARRLHHARFVGQPSRLQVSHGRDGIELTNLQASNRQNSGSTSHFSDPSPYELQVSLSNSGNPRSESRSPRAAPRNIRAEPSPYELQASLSNNDNSRSVDERHEGAQDNTSRSGRPRRQRARRHAHRGNMDIMDRLPRPAPEPRHYERRLVPRRVAALQGERFVDFLQSRSPIDRAQTVSPLTESDLGAPFVPIPEYDEYPEHPEYI